MSLIITDEFCECGMPAEIQRVVFWHATENGHECIAVYQCVNGHSWEGELEEVDE